MKMNLKALDTKEPESYATLTKQLDVYDSYLKNIALSSNEGLGTGLVKIFVGVTDVFLRVGHTFKTNVFKFHKSLKRSEMKFYSESHVLKCKLVESKEYSQFFKLPVDIPSGLVVPFVDAVKLCIDSYTDPDLITMVTGAYKNLEIVRTQLARLQDDYKQIFIPMRKVIDERTRLVSNLTVTGAKIFTDKRTNQIPFEKAYNSMLEFKEVRTTLLGLESKLTDAMHLIKLIDELDNVISDITRALQDDTNMDIAFVTDLSKVVRYLAAAFDLHGVTMSRQMALEHNHILNINACYASIS